MRWTACCLLLVCCAASAQDVGCSPRNVDGDNTAYRLLVRAYLKASDFAPPERGFFLTRLSQVAAKIEPSYSTLWSEETFRLSFQLPLTWNRVAMEKNALVNLAATDPDRSFELFHLLDAPVATEGGRLPEDVRADAARTVFLAYWKHRGIVALPAIQREAAYLAETGEYPFVAMIPIMKDIGKADSAATSTVFAQAVAAYSRGTTIESADSDFKTFLLELDGVVPDDQLASALDPFVDKLLKPSRDSRDLFAARAVSRNKAVELSDPQSLVLLQLMPLVRRLQPSRAKEIEERRPEMRNSGAPEHTEAAVIEEGFTQGNVSARALRNLERSRLARVEMLASTDPSEAFRLAQTLSNPAFRATGTAYAAEGMAKTKPDQASEMLRQAKSQILGTHDESERLQLLAALASAASAVKNKELCRELLERGIPLGTALFQRDMDANPRQPALFAVGFEELASLTRSGMRCEPGWTLSQLDSLDNDVLQAYLFAEAADAYSPLVK